jgi:hypothetical protein
LEIRNRPARQRTAPTAGGVRVGESEGNHLVYLRWRDRSPEEVLAQAVQEDVLAALREAPEE